MNNTTDFQDSYFGYQVSSLVDYVRTGVKTKGHSTEPHNALKFFRTLGCSTQGQLYDYQYNKVTQALSNGMPVYIRGNRDSGGGHAWVADGYVMRTVIKKQVVKYMFVETQDNGTVARYWYEDLPNNTSTSYNLLHFNWGWGLEINANGYYSSSVFDTNKKMTPLGNYFNSSVAIPGKRYYYNKNIEIITDIKPRQ